MLKPDDTLQFYTSPYRRTRETADGILRTLTSDDAELGPSPFQRHKIKVYEEPRLREQDFGNFQPCSAEMERMWQERADYGHFFYRIPNGESAADAYDRVSGFNESLWRSLSEPDFPSVCVIVTHGLMSRIFLMKWCVLLIVRYRSSAKVLYRYHWSVEYFEDLRNMNHCEFIVMKKNEDNGKYILQNELRTWSDLQRRAALANGTKVQAPPTTNSGYAVPSRRWGGCSQGCDHAKFHIHKKLRRGNTMDSLQHAALTMSLQQSKGKDSNRSGPQEQDNMNASGAGVSMKTKSNMKAKGQSLDEKARDRIKHPKTDPTSDTTPAATNRNLATTKDTDDGAVDTPVESVSDGDSSSEVDELNRSDSTSPRHLNPASRLFRRPTPMILARGRDAGGSRSGVGSPDFSDESDYFNMNGRRGSSSVQKRGGVRSPLTAVEGGSIDTSSIPQDRDGNDNEEGRNANGKAKATSSGRKSARKEQDANVRSEKDWEEESGMTSGRMADALGDMDEDSDDLEDVTEEEVEAMKDKSRKGFSEVY